MSDSATPSRDTPGSFAWRPVVAILAAAVLLAASVWLARANDPAAAVDDGRAEVVFWHFWGGDDRDVVDAIVARFNETSKHFRVRAIAMPGNNLQAKLFLSIAGGDPPDLVNQDDPIVGDWGSRGFIVPIDVAAGGIVCEEIEQFLFPSARRLGTFGNRTCAVCNGLDVRALYVNKTTLDEYNLDIPRSIDDLDQLARTISPPESTGPETRSFGYLPDSRRLWAWGYVFGGEFAHELFKVPTIDHPGVVRAARWMQRYSQWYGADTINRFRAGDQSLPGKSFPLLPGTDEAMTGRYAAIMDGQWRVRDIRNFLQRRRELGIPAPEFAVCPLPVPAEGLSDAGWVNGNVFVIPRGAKQARGAVEFIQFWIGMTRPEQAAEACAAGGWIPVSPAVIETAVFQDFLRDEPLFAEFVRLAGSNYQFPIPVIRGAPVLKRTVEQAGAEIMSQPDADAEVILRQANERLQRQLPERPNRPPAF